MGLLLQRLFATFPEGWPGTGLLLVRAVAAIPVVLLGIEGLLTAPLQTRGITLGTLEVAAACFAVLLLVGLWTPVAGVLMLSRSSVSSCRMRAIPGCTSGSGL